MQIQKQQMNFKKLSTSYQATVILLSLNKAGSGVVILDRTKYIDKCFFMLATKQFSPSNIKTKLRST